jgi:hypothetical protein
MDREVALYRIPAERPSLLFAYGYRGAVSTVYGKLGALGKASHTAGERAVALQIVGDWARRYVDAACHRVRERSRHHAIHLLEDLEFAERIPDSITADPVCILELGSMALATAVTGSIAAAEAIAGTCTSGVFDRLAWVERSLDLFRTNGDRRWTAEWSEVLRDYPWLRCHEIRWPHVSLSPLSEPSIYFVVDARRPE